MKVDGARMARETEFEEIKSISEQLKAFSEGLTSLKDQVNAITVDRKYYSQSNGREIELIREQIDDLQKQSVSLEQEVKSSIDKLEAKIEKVSDKLDSQIQAQDDDIEAIRDNRSDLFKQLLVLLLSAFVGWVFSKM